MWHITSLIVQFGMDSAATCSLLRTIANVVDEAELPRFKRVHTADPFIVACFEFWREAEEAMEN